jgi:hypothetical protein
MSQEDEEHIRGISGDSEKRDEEEEDYDSELDKEIDEELPRADLPTIVAPKLDAAQELFLAKVLISCCTEKISFSVATATRKTLILLYLHPRLWYYDFRSRWETALGHENDFML